MANGRLWTPEENRRLRELCEQGLTIQEIAKQLDREPSATYWRLHAYGLSAKRADNGQKWTQKEIKRLIKLVRQGKTRERIAALMGRTFQSVRRKLQDIREREYATAPRCRLDRYREPTEAELDALIERQRKNLPAWWEAETIRHLNAKRQKVSADQERETSRTATIGRTAYRLAGVR